MTSLSSRLLSFLARALDPDDREAALGDLVESKATFGAALHSVLGLIVRRQLQAWRAWKPWLGFVGVSVACGAALLYFSAWFSGAFELYFWLIDNYEHFDPAMLHDAGITFEIGIPLLLRHGALLLLWSWTAGFAFGTLSRGVIWIASMLLIVVAASILTCLTWSGWNPSTGRLLAFTSLMLFAVMPAFVTGAWLGVCRGALSPMAAQAVAYLVALVTMVAAWNAGWWFGAPNAAVFPLCLVLSWPAVFVLATARTSSGRMRKQHS